MDSLTQIVLGAAVGEAILGKKVDNKAILYGALAGTIPDLDTFAGYLTDPVTAIEWHRGFSHSIVFSILAAPLFGYLISKIEHKSSATWKDWTKLMFWGLLTHPILDAFTTWGTQLFWPLDIRLAFKSIFVIDPLYTLPFLIFLIMAMRQKRGSLKRKRYNNLGLIISTTYLLSSLVLKSMAYLQFEESLEQQGIFYERMETRPSPLNTILWNANVETEDAFLTADYSFFDEDMIRFHVFPKNHAYLGSLRKHETIQQLIDITNGWYTISSQDGQLIFNDLRFGQLNPSNPNSDFTFSYKLIEENGELKVEETEKDRSEAKKILIDLWERIKGN
ncbi:metal-dependent hydrolase [Salinimicrobium sp. GXAS 041]|uniref:metal-dependent hydrolase n=1 Tax=Salinimicrobium sp. GXAS 041 TaxID=3400806 RepID=UPI003C76908C